MSLGHMLSELMQKIEGAVGSAKVDLTNIRKDFTPEDLDTLKFFFDDFKALSEKYLLLVKTANRLPLADVFTDILVDTAEAIKNGLGSHNNRFITHAFFRKIADETGSDQYFKDFVQIAEDARKLYNDIWEEKKMNMIKAAPIEEEPTAEDMMKSQKEKAAEFLGMTPEEVDAELKKSTPSAQDVMTETGEGEVKE